MPKLATITPADPAIEAHWARAARFVEGATLFQRASLAAQIMAGMELVALHKHYGMRQGKRTDLPNTLGSWPEAVKARLGVSDQTAYNWMKMAQDAKQRLKKGDIDLGAILEKHPGALTPAEQELLKIAVYKISDGQTQLEFMQVNGSVKLPQGYAAKGGDTRAAAAANAAAAAGLPAPQSDIPEGCDPRAWQLNQMLTEALMDGWWNDCTVAFRRTLHGNLLDATTQVAATLKGPQA